MRSNSTQVAVIGNSNAAREGLFDEDKILEIDKILNLSDELVTRIHERFPGANLCTTVRRLHKMVSRAEGVAKRLRRRAVLLPFFSLVLVIGLVGAAGYGVFLLHPELKKPSTTELIQSSEAAFNMLIFFGAGTFWLLSIERRRKDARWNGELAKFRSLTHVFDMHQLNKDPDRLFRTEDDNTSSSPELPKYVDTAFKMTRYLDDVAEAAAIIGKVASYYGQFITEPAVLTTVSEIGLLTGGLRATVNGKNAMLFPVVRSDYATAIDKIAVEQRASIK